MEAVFDEGELRNWYPGVVQRVHGDGSYEVRWDDPDGGPEVSTVLQDEIHGYTPPLPLEQLSAGSRHEGTVVGIAPYGVFVDIGAVRDGLVHVSCVRPGFVRDISKEVRLGQKVTASQKHCFFTANQKSRSCCLLFACLDHYCMIPKSEE